MGGIMMIHKPIQWTLITIFTITTVLLGCSKSNNHSNESETLQISGDTKPVTADAVIITDSSAKMRGTFVNPSGYTTTAWIEYGTTGSYGFTLSVSAQYAVAGFQEVIADISGLASSSTYHYRLVTNNSGGTFYSSDKTFTTFITPTTLVSGGSSSNLCANGYNNTDSIALDSTSVFWTDNNGAVNKIGINGGMITTLATGTYSSGITLDSTNVYWIDGMSIYDRRSIYNVSKNGGIITNNVSGVSSPIVNIAADSTNVYWANGSSINKVGINGGTITPIAVIAKNNIRIAVDSTSVYWVEGPPSGTTVKKVDINGGTTTTLTATPPLGAFENNDYIPPIYLDSTSVYWTDGGSIYKIGKNGGTLISLASYVSGRDLTVDSTSVYWINVPFYSGSEFSYIYKFDINSSATTTLIGTHGLISAIAVDDKNVYWITCSSDVKKIAK
jgi:hypothetical protein